MLLSFTRIAGLLVIVNYIFVVTYYPCVVYYHHVFLKDTSFCGFFKDRPDPEPYAPRRESASEAAGHALANEGSLSLDEDER